MGDAGVGQSLVFKVSAKHSEKHSCRTYRGRMRIFLYFLPQEHVLHDKKVGFHQRSITP